MKKGCYIQPSRIKVSTVKDGQSIEEMIRKATQNNEPIQGNAKLLYTEEKDGINPAFDIRTDRWDLAVMASDRVHASNYAKRMSDLGFVMDENGKYVPVQPKSEEAKS